ncbi:MAG TPA: hypothetical protein VKR38_16195 [Usitatibacter sp.]|nr:hypothetical protein [Usitatibacter sp.]
MKRFLVGALASFAVVSTAQAVGTTNNDFTVKLTSFNSQCSASNSGTTTMDFGTYTAFQATAATGSAVNLTFNCTHNFAPTSAAFDVVNGNAAGLGVLVGLQYQLTIGAPGTVAGTAATLTTGAGADVVTYNITGSMASGQAGQCATATCGPASHTRTLIVTF